MSGLFQNLAFDQISFWIGFLSGALGLWLVSKLLPAIPELSRSLRNRSRSAGRSLARGNANRHRQDLLRHVQGMHLASSLFALDEILIEPQVLAFPSNWQNPREIHDHNIYTHTIPYLPDWPELAARFSAPAISISEALSDGANLILIGGPGSGKSTALSHLACQIIRKETNIPGLNELLPVYIHVADLFPQAGLNEDPIIQILSAVSHYSKSISDKRLETLLQQSLQTGRALLLLDGLDEIAPDFHQEVVTFIKMILENYPSIRLVVCASPQNFSGLVQMGLVPVAMAIWENRQYISFINKWSRSWFRYIRPTIQEKVKPIDPRLLNAWLQAEHPVITPFDATLKVWSVFAGDTLGPSHISAIESYIWRVTNPLENSRPGLEDFALQMVASLRVSQDLRSGRGWEVEFEAIGPESNDEGSTASPPKRNRKASRKLPGVLPKLLESGILVQRTDDQLAFCHPLIMAYLASNALIDVPISHFLSNQPDWTGKSLTMLFLSASRELSPEVSELFSQNSDPILRNALTIGRWLRYAPQSATWRAQAMRFLATELQRENIALGLRARLLSALLQSGDPGVNVLLRQISHTGNDDLRLLAALGMGYLLDTQALPRLSEMLTEADKRIFQSACLSLAKIGNKQSMEILGSALLKGSEDLRRAVAEALAVDPGEGHEMLKDASEMDDLLVRRSAVFGLALIDQDWAKTVLKKLALEDKEWIVRSAATEIIEGEGEVHREIPQSVCPLHELPWLIEFAGERGLGIAPGSPAENLLLSALSEGTSTQQVAAMNTLQLHPNPAALPRIMELLEENRGIIQQAAFETLWFFAGEGVEIIT